MTLGHVSRYGATAVLAALWAGGAVAQLDATYAGNVSAVCINSPKGFDQNYGNKAAANISSFVAAGTVTFNPDGTGTNVTRALRIGHATTAAGQTPAVQNETSCPFNYTYDERTRAVYATFGTCTSTALTGPGAGDQIEIRGQHAHWLLLDEGGVLVNVMTHPIVETLTNLATNSSSQRICHRTNQRFLRSAGGES